MSPPSETPTAAEVTLTLRLTAPNVGDGGIVFTVSGPSLLGVTARSGLEMTERTASGNGLTTSTVEGGHGPAKVPSSPGPFTHP